MYPLNHSRLGPAKIPNIKKLLLNVVSKWETKLFMTLFVISCKFSLNCFCARWSRTVQARRHGRALRRRAFPNDCLCPPKRGLCPEDINRLWATGVQSEAQTGVCQRYFSNFCGLTPDFMTFLGWRPFFFFFFWRSPVFGRKNRLNFWFRPENSSEFLVFTLIIWSRLR